MENRERWLVCSGGAEFVTIAGALVASGRARAIEWEPDALRAYTRAAALRGGEVACAVVGDGLVGVADEDAACTLAALVDGHVVLCTARAAQAAARVVSRGVAAAVEAAGLPCLLDQLPAGEAVGDGAPAWAGEVGGCVDDLEEPAGYGFEDARPTVPDALGVPPMRPTGQLPRVGATDELPSLSVSSLIETEPVVYRPLISLPQLDCTSLVVGASVPTICFASARGGVGKTALAAMAAVALAREGLTVALIDMDFQFGTCLGYLGAEETDGLLDPGELPDNVRMDARLLARCRAIPEPRLMAYEFCKVPEQAEVLAPFASALLKAAREGADVAVVDLPTGVGEATAQVLEAADRCLLVTDRRSFSIESLTAQQSLCARMGIPRTKLVTVVNRCDPRHRDESFLERLRFASQTSQILKVVEGGQEVSQMLAIGSAGELLTARNRFALSVADLAHAIAAEVGCRAAEGAVAGGAVAGAPGVLAGAAASERRSSRRRRKERREEAVECPF